jgi:hypothetical protein
MHAGTTLTGGFVLAAPAADIDELDPEPEPPLLFIPFDDDPLDDPEGLDMPPAPLPEDVPPVLPAVLALPPAVPPVVPLPVLVDDAPAEPLDSLGPPSTPV